MLLRVLSNGLQLLLSETIVRVVWARCCYADAMKASANAKALAAKAKSQRERPISFLSDNSWTSGRRASTSPDDSSSGLDKLAACKTLATTGQSKIGRAAALVRPLRNPAAPKVAGRHPFKVLGKAYGTVQARRNA